MVYFSRTRISRTLAARIKSLVEAGESAIIISPRFGGREYVTEEVRRELFSGDLPVVSFSLAFDSPPSRREIELTVHEGGETRITTDDPIAAADEIYAHAAIPPVLIADGVDGMSEVRARHFLMQVRSRVEARQLVAILTGSKDLRDLVHGPNSEFNCANQYLLQGHDAESFRDMFEKYSVALGIKWLNADRASANLYHQTGGIGYLLRIQLAFVLEFCVRAGDRGANSSGPLDSDCIQWDRWFRGQGGSEPSWPDQFRSGIEVIAAADPSVWGALELLLRDGESFSPQHYPAPGPLELSGFFVLRRDGRYALACPMFAEFVRSYYSNLRVGALYARAGLWGDAFKRFESCEPGYSLFDEDESEAILVVRALESDLHSVSAASSEQVERLFCRGVCWLFGFSEVMLWRFQGSEWVGETNVSGRDVSEHLSLFRSLDNLGVAFGRFGFAIKLHTHSAQVWRGITIGDFAGRHVISSSRRSVIERLTKQLLRAHQNAIEGEISRRRLQTRERYTEITRSILGAVGESILDVRQALELAAENLVHGEYSRVMFSLVDPVEGRIVGTVGISRQLPSLVEFTNYTIEDEDVDVQPWVVKHAKEIIVSRPIEEPRVNRRMLEHCIVGPFAIVPIFGRHGEVIGTIHVERQDGFAPSQEEVDDLKELGRQLGGVINESERTTLLLTALNGLREPILLLNRNREVVYGNSPACELFPIIVPQAGWQRSPEVIPPDALGFDYAGRALREAHLVRSIFGVGVDKEYRGTLLLAQINDWRGVTVGGLLHIRDQRFLHAVHSALTAIAAASKSTVIDAIVDAVVRLGFDRVRFYAYDLERAVLVSHSSRGLLNQEIAAMFEHGDLILPWLVAEFESAAISWKVEKGSSATVIVNEFGLEQRVIQAYPFQGSLEKADCAEWIDVPLQTDGRRLGMLTLERSSDAPVHPEEFENLKVFGKLASAIFEAIEDRRTLKEAFDKALGIMAHQFRNQLAGIKGVLNSYELLALEAPRSKAVLATRNETFRREVSELESILIRAPEFLGKIQTNFEPLELRSLFETLQGNLRAEIRFDFDRFDLEGDIHHLRTCLSEMIENAVQMVPGRLAHIAVRAREQDGYAVIELADDGPGVSVEDKVKIFELDFSKRPGATRSTGWGLYFVRRVIEAHGGAIAETGVSGIGACFRVSFPRWRKGPLSKVPIVPSELSR